MENKSNYSKYITPGLYIVGGFIAYKLLNTLFEGLGLKKTSEEKAIDDTIEDSFNRGKDAWNPQFYQNAKAAGRVIQDVSAMEQERLKRMIYNQCVGYLYDSPAYCLTALKSLSYQTQVSVLSHAFFNAYGKDLLSFIVSNLNNTQDQKRILADILNHVASLPRGY